MGQDTPIEVTLESLIETSEVFANAFALSREMTLEQLVSKMEEVKYKAFGFEMVMIYRNKDTGLWGAGLRNDSGWRNGYLSCKGASMYEALRQLYAWCVYREYLK